MALFLLLSFSKPYGIFIWIHKVHWAMRTCINHSALKLDKSAIFLENFISNSSEKQWKLILVPGDPSICWIFRKYIISQPYCNLERFLDYHDFNYTFLAIPGNFWSFWAPIVLIIHNFSLIIGILITGKNFWTPSSR